MTEENKTESSVQEAEVESVSDSTQEQEMEQSKEKRERRISGEMVMIFIIGILFGMAIKTEVSKQINVVDKNFYAKQAYDLNAKQKQVEDQKPEAAPAQDANPSQQAVPGQSGAPVQDVNPADGQPTN
jgi:hypothetical protein